MIPSFLHFLILTFISFFSLAKTPVKSVAPSASETPLLSFHSDLETFKNKSLNLESEKQNLLSSSDQLLAKKLFWTPLLTAKMSEGQSFTDDIKTKISPSVGAGLQWQLFQGGKSLNDLAAAKAQYKAQELQLFNETLKVEVEASDLIFKNIYLLEMVRLSEEMVKLKEESLKITMARYRQGRLPHHEWTKAEVDLSQQKAKLRNARLDLFENKTELQALWIEKVKTTTWPFNENLHPSLPTSTSSSTPSFLPLTTQKYWLSQSLEESWKSAKSLHYPTLSFNLDYSQALSENRTRNLTGMLILSFPLWNQYETSAYISQSYSYYLTSMNNYKMTEQKLTQKNSYLQEKIATTRSNLVEAKKNLHLSKELYQEIYRGFQMGRISINDLLIEQNRLIESQNALTLSQLNFHQSLVEYCALSGVKAADCLHQK